jgi:hypothetical protein
VLARLLRPALGLALVGATTLALGASAAPAPPTVLEDVAGDANLLNTQILNLPQAGNGVATPGSQPGVDILKVELKNTYAPARKGQPATCTGVTMTMVLSGPPADSSRFRLSGDTAVNSRFFIIEHDSGTGETGIRYGGPGEDETLPLKPAVVKDSAITWTITPRNLKSIGEEPGNELSALQATTTASVQGVLFFPIFDKAPGGDKTFTLCG